MPLAAPYSVLAMMRARDQMSALLIRTTEIHSSELRLLYSDLFPEIDKERPMNLSI